MFLVDSFVIEHRPGHSPKRQSFPHPFLDGFKDSPQPKRPRPGLLAQDAKRSGLLRRATREERRRVLGGAIRLDNKRARPVIMDDFESTRTCASGAAAVPEDGAHFDVQD